LKRNEVIQKIVDRKKARTYLEIGVGSGNNFFKIKVKEKIAVDPAFKFSTIRRLRWMIKNPYNLFAKYYPTTSDHFFEKAENLSPPDVVFIDGLHEYRQALKDVENTLKHLKKNGVIVMHDCSPPSAAAATTSKSYEHVASLHLPGWEGTWCGDVWKAICHLRSERRDLRIFVLDCDYGLGVITRGNPENILDLIESDINEMTYEEFSQQRKELLNLKEENYLAEFLETI